MTCCSQRKHFLALLTACVLATTSLAVLASSASALDPKEASAPKALTLSRALAVATRKNPRLRSHSAGVEAAQHVRTSRRSNYLPRVSVDANGLVWDRALNLALGGGSGAGGLPPPATPYEQALAGFLGAMSKPTTIREQFTAEVGLSITQPLSALLTLSTGYKLFDLTVTIRALQRKEAVRTVQLSTATAYFRLLQMRAMSRAAQQSVLKMQAQALRVDRLIRRGVAGKNDRLKIDVAVAATQQQALRAQMAATMAEAALVMWMGEPVGTRHTPVAPPSRVIRPASINMKEACTAAVANRVEAKMARAGVKMAQMAHTLEKAKLTPSLNLHANYKFTHGSSFANSNAGFIGVMFQWRAFRWGATTSQIKAAASRITEIRLQVEALKSGICLAVQGAILQHQTAVKTLDVAKRAEIQAIEAVRLETVRLEAGSATSTDVVVAEAALRAAQSNRLAAYYQTFVAHAQYLAARGTRLSGRALTEGE